MLDMTALLLCRPLTQLLLTSLMAQRVAQTATIASDFLW